jgi:hypothetical protein
MRYWWREAHPPAFKWEKTKCQVQPSILTIAMILISSFCLWSVDKVCNWRWIDFSSCWCPGRHFVSVQHGEGVILCTEKPKKWLSSGHFLTPTKLFKMVQICLQWTSSQTHEKPQISTPFKQNWCQSKDKSLHYCLICNACFKTCFRWNG